jgi:hypothetical protein
LVLLFGKPQTYFSSAALDCYKAISTTLEDEMMKHYHGTPLGGTRDEVARFLRGRHALIPYPRPEDLPIAADVCRSFVFDNGAFTVWKQGGQLDVPGYIEWCEKWHRHPGFEWALIPDVIEGDETDNDALLSEWPKSIAGVPVYHMHEKTSRLERLAEDWPIVAIGSSGVWSTPGSGGWWNRMATIMDAVCDSEGRPACKLHGLRMMAPDIFTRLPLASADSTNVAQNKNLQGRFGIYCPPTASQRAAVIAERIEAHNSAPVWESPAQKIMFDGFGELAL